MLKIAGLFFWHEYLRQKMNFEVHDFEDHNKIKFADIKTKEDYVFWLKITLNDKKIFAVQHNLTKWRKLDDSLSSSSLQKFYDGYLVYRKYMNFNILKSFICLMSLSFNYFLKEIKK